MHLTPLQRQVSPSVEDVPLRQHAFISPSPRGAVGTDDAIFKPIATPASATGFDVERPRATGDRGDNTSGECGNSTSEFHPDIHKRALHKYELTAGEYKPKSDNFPRWLRTSLNCCLLGGAMLLSADTITTVSVFQKQPRLKGLDGAIISNGITAANAFVWLLVWDLFMGFECVIEKPRMALGLLVPGALSCMDLVFTMNSLGSGTWHRLRRGLNVDATAIINVAFAMGTLMTALRSNRGTHTIMYALILCLALVVPQFATPPNSTGRTVVTSIQKASLNNAIGLIIAGISADLLAGSTQSSSTKDADDMPSTGGGDDNGGSGSGSGSDNDK